MDILLILETTKDICEQLNETKKAARGQVRRLVEFAGIELAQDILRQTLEIEGQGGMMTADGSRRRTPGGVFFYLAHQQVPASVRRKIFWRGRKKKQAKKPEAEAEAPKPAPKPKLSPEAASKLKQLELAAQTLRQRIADLKEKPEKQRFGLPMVERSLANTEKQIETILQQATKT